MDTGWPGVLLAAAPRADVLAVTSYATDPSILGQVFALVTAAAALYLPGLAVARLLPAPRFGGELQVAVAPLLSIVVAGVGVRVLSALSVSLQALQLLAVTAVLWLLVWRLHTARSMTPREVGANRRVDRLGLVLSLGLGSLLWIASLADIGLALPNRDFKNHALFVAQIAVADSVDPGVVLPPSPVAGGASGPFYPLGLHALLAWALPDRTGSTVAITAAAAVVVTVISLPLAVRALARMWVPDDPRVALLAGVVAVCLPGASSGAFAIGSVVLLVGIALYAAALGVLWQWSRDPRPGTSVLLLLCFLGLYWLHVAEALGLALVACGLPLVAEARQTLGRHRRAVAAAAAFGLVAVLATAVLLRGELEGLLSLRTLDWDLQPNDAGPGVALAQALLQQPVPLSPLCLAWWGVCVGGLVWGRKQGQSGLPGWALAVAVLLGTATTLRLPGALAWVTAPWYGTAARVMLLAFPVLVVVVSAAVVAAADHARSRALHAGILCVSVLLVGTSSAGMVPERRADLAASLPDVAATAIVGPWLADELRAGGTVLNLEADGTPLLFAQARVPVLSGMSQRVVDEPVGGKPLSEQLLDLDDPSVATRLAQLDVRFLVLGTGNLYWGQGIGYDWRQVAAQPQVQLVVEEPRLVVLRYRGGAS